MEWSHSVLPITWFRKTYLDGYLVLKPPYQRKPVWQARQKSSLIETVLLNMPIPEIFVQQVTSPEGETTYAVVDGQQRIRTILQFVGVETDPDEQESNNFSLGFLPTDSKWKDASFSDLSATEKRAFFEYRFVVRNLHTDSDQQVRDVFRRLNKNLSPLTSQELRNAIYTGPFVHAVTRLAENQFFAENRIVTPAAIRRMGDVEFVSELLIGVLHGPQGGSAANIDPYYEQYEDFEEEFPGQREAEELYEETLRTIRRILPNIKETRWHNKSDFYTLFVATSVLLRSGDLPTKALPKVRNTLIKFADEILRRNTDENANVSEDAVQYTRAVRKGANDKSRRAARHIAMLNVLRSFFDAHKEVER